MWNLRIILGLLPALAICASGYEHYNSASAVCCSGEVISLPVASDNRNYYSCCYNEDDNSATTYNYITQECCDGKVFDWPDEDGSYGCCGAQLYDYGSQICCHNSIYEKMEGYDDCCGDQPYSLNENFCCFSWDEKGIYIGTLYHYNDGQTDCCNGVAYNAREQLCCDGKVLDKPDEDGSYDCCGDQPYISDEKICCSYWEENDIATDTLYDNNGSQTACCKGVAYNTGEQLCCESKVHSIPDSFDNDANIYCCNGVLYDRNKQVCCKDWKEDDWDRIHKSGQLFDIEYNKTYCCGLQIYDYHTEVCCNEDDTIIPKPAEAHPDSFLHCCGGKALTDYETQICLNGKLVEMENSYWWECGDELYDTRNEGCCNGQKYDTENQLCCDSEVVQKSEADIAAGVDSCCSFEERYFL